MDTCPDIATLRSRIPTAAGEQIAVAAYYDDWSANNRQPTGGGTFVAKAQSTPADDGGMFIRPNASWVWVRALDVAGTLSPYMYGAKGDGINDDAAAIQQAHDYASSLASLSGSRILKNGNLVFGNGRFKCLATLNLNVKTVDYDFSGALLDFSALAHGTEAKRMAAIAWQNGAGYTQGNLSARNLRMIGPGADSFVDGMTFSTSLSESYARNSLTFQGGAVEGFAYGLTGTSHFYFLRMYGFTFNHCDICYYFPNNATDSGEEMNFHSCVFAQSNCGVKLQGGYSYFFNCSFDYIYGKNGEQTSTSHVGKYMHIEGGQHIFRDCHVEGYGPQNYIMNVPDDKSCKVNVIGGLFTFKAGGSPSTYPTTSNPFYVGNLARVVFEKVNIGQMQQGGDANVSGWFDGTGSVSLHDTQLPIAWPYLLTQVRTDAAVQDNWLDSSTYTSGAGNEKWTEEVWVLPPGGVNTVRKSRYGWGTENSTNFSIIRQTGFVSLGRNLAAGSGVFQAVLGTIKLKGYGSVIHHIRANTYAGEGQSCQVKIVWAKLSEFGAQQDVEPKILMQQTGHSYTYNFSGSESQLKTEVIPGQMQGYATQPPSFERAPDWATHAFLLVDTTKMKSNFDLRITDVYLRQV
ncbi:hypothetical protein [Serratia ficaria]|uniref:hypothetical protein n=1 Tax=Serratia ficaria TaxID=61651 RepID=UPI00077C4101|nr:hypothetical protein [Serratia ficaria]CAI1647550.1 Uncharacterised protein [Serratia ficaria]CAI1930217.1 Uncharacterised protein [Serratia ficaria]CAI2428537.1 Uncharacterised protein [Serratia ficaria]CAI2454381.1 Uncharacterised protein [Serratia ficaria]CAI2503715.1 Uncharacterised protein [Serratia ficaria]